MSVGEGKSWGKPEYATPVHTILGVSSFLLLNESPSLPHPITPIYNPIPEIQQNLQTPGAKSISYEGKWQLIFKWFFIHKLDASLQNLLYIAK